MHLSKDIKLSIVVTARNDDHGGGFMRRMQIFVNGLITQCDRHKLKAELIIVEWNPPSGKPGLSQALTWPDNSGFCTVRIIEVPPEIHNRYKYAHKLPLYQMIAKNVGMRRARGRFILATNIDVLFNDELMQFLANGELREGVSYRIDRTDVSEDVPLQATIDEQLDYCLENIIRINCREGTHQKLTGRYYPSYGHIDVVLTNLHFNACGDFTLMSTADWHRLNGYPEFDMYSPHLDSLMLIISYYAGIRQEILREPMRLYHLEHGGAWIAENASKLEQEKKTEKIPVLKLSQFEGWTSEMNAKGQPIIFNDNRWGFAYEDLKDTVVIAADWEANERPDDSNNISHSGNGKKENTEKSILIIAGNIPAFDSVPHDGLYLIIRALAETHKVTFVARRGAEKGKYVEHLRRLGVIVFYDEDGLMEQASLDASVTSQFASSVSVKTLFAHHEFNVILLGSSGISSCYIPVVREFSPKSALVIKADESNLAAEHENPDKAYGYHEADMVIAFPDKAKKLSEEHPYLNIKTLPESGDASRFIEVLFMIINKCPAPLKNRPDRFRMLQGSLPDEMLRLTKSAVTVIFILNNNHDISRLSLDKLFKYSDPELSNVIVALNNKKCHGFDKEMERKARYYFKYDNASERDKFITGIIRKCQSEYVAIVEDSVIVCPQWDRRLTAHLRNNTGTGLITAGASGFLYESVYEFEKDAYKIHEQYKGQNKPANIIEAPCLIFKRVLAAESERKDLKGILDDLTAADKTAVALDTLVIYMRKGLKVKDPIAFKRTSDRKASVIIPVLGNVTGLPECLNSLFRQKNINYENIEIVVVYEGSDSTTIHMLSSIEAPCAFKYIVLQGKTLSAALNAGIREASGEYILFVSQETVVDEDLISEHLKTHLKYAGKDIAVLGHITVSGIDDSSPFSKFLSKNPKRPFASPLVYNYSDISNPENAGHFYLPNISLHRKLFNEIGLFDETLQDGWESMEFGSRFALKGHRVVYSRKPVVTCSPEINFAAFMDRQISVGRQYAIMAYMHPNIWYPDKAKKECLHHLIGKQTLIESAAEIVRTLEDMPEDILKNYRYAGMSLLDKCYSNLLNYYFARGINDVISRHEGEGWFSRYAERNDINIDGMINKNRAYELLLESYWHSGCGDHESFSKCIEKSSSLLDAHPGPYYAAGNFYFNQNEYVLAEVTFEKGIEKRKYYDDDHIFPVEDESLYFMWLAMACIPQGKYKKAAEALEQLIAERVTLSAEQEAMIYKCLSLCYKALNKTKKAVFCRQEADRLYEDLKVAAELSRV